MSKRLLEPSPILYSVPVVLASCGTAEKPNIITLAWAGTICSDPPMVSISIRPGRHSHGLVKASGEFVLNLPTADQVEQVDYCGTNSGRRVDKFAVCQFTPVPASAVGVPLIAQCPVNLECKVQQVLSLGTHDLFIARILAVQADEDAVTDKGKLDAARVRPMACLNQSYYRLGDLLGAWGTPGKKLSS